MPISTVRESQAARILARKVLDERIERDFGSLPLPGELGVLPLYGIPSQHMLNGQYRRSWRSGWRYIWVHSELASGAIVDIRRTRSGKAQLQRYALGLWVSRLFERLTDAERRFGDGHIRFRPRILRLPAIHMEALWLNPANPTDQDHFFSLLDPLEDDAFVAECHKRLVAQIVPQSTLLVKSRQ